jgi:diadenosine tetraphosphate (Ap4A) HIT family hydrolase
VERRRPVDVAAYLRQTREQVCFVCQIVDGEATLPNPVVFEDDDAIAWVNPYQLVLGYTLVAPKAHREHVTGDFMSDEYLALQAVVHR